MIAKNIKGRGFRGVVDYVLRENKGFLLNTNMAGETPREFAQEFGAIRAYRPNLTKAVCHVSISLRPQESLTDQQWQEVAEEYLFKMGFTDNQYLVAKHTDTNRQHIHIVVNRIGMEGQVVSDSHDYRRQEEIMRQLEHKYGLQPTPNSKSVGRKALTRGELEKALRTQKPPPKMLLQNMLDKYLQLPITVTELTTQLAQNGVEVKLNQASTGRISGISFALDGLAFKGSSLGKAYTWNNLQKRGLINDRTNDRQTEESQGLELSGRRGHDNSQQETANFQRGIDSGSKTAPDHANRESQNRANRTIDETIADFTDFNQKLRAERPRSRARSKGISR